MKALNTNSPVSSLRLNMLMVTIGTLPTLLAVAFYVIWKTVHDKEPDFAAISLFIVALGGFFAQLWYFKNQNKKTEVEAGEVANEKPVS
jgi:hypothetical protein